MILRKQKFYNVKELLEKNEKPAKKVGERTVNNGLTISDQLLR